MDNGTWFQGLTLTNDQVWQVLQHYKLGAEREDVLACVREFLTADSALKAHNHLGRPYFGRDYQEAYSAYHRALNALREADAQLQKAEEKSK